MSPGRKDRKPQPLTLSHLMTSSDGVSCEPGALRRWRTSCRRRRSRARASSSGFASELSKLWRQCWIFHIVHWRLFLYKWEQHSTAVSLALLAQLPQVHISTDWTAPTQQWIRFLTATINDTNSFESRQQMQPNCDLTRPTIWAHVVVLWLAQAPKTDGSWVQLKLSPIVFPLLWDGETRVIAALVQRNGKVRCRKIRPAHSPPLILC